MQIIRGPGTSGPSPNLPTARRCRGMERAKIIERTTRRRLHRCAWGDEHGVREDRPRLIPTGRANHYSASPIAGSSIPFGAYADTA
jgi:hypothetical protein